MSATRAEPRPHRHQKKSEVVARRLIDRIVTDDLDGGHRLEHEGELVDQLGVSRATLREAFRLLEITGVLELRPGREGGPVVQQPSGEDFARMATFFFQVTRCTYRQLLHAVIALQPEVYHQAALVADDADKARLQALWDDPVGRARNDDDDVLAMSRLPIAVAEATHNPVLVLIVSALEAVFHRHMDRLLVGVPHRRRGAQVARSVVRSIVAGDGDRAERLSRANLQAWLGLAEQQYPHLLDAVVSWDQ